MRVLISKHEHSNSKLYPRTGLDLHVARQLHILYNYTSVVRNNCGLAPPSLVHQPTYLSQLLLYFSLLFTGHTLHSVKVMTVQSTLLSSHACTLLSLCCGLNRPNKTGNIISFSLKYFIIFRFEPTNII